MLQSPLCFVIETGEVSDAVYNVLISLLLMQVMLQETFKLHNLFLSDFFKLGFSPYDHLVTAI